MKTKKIVYTALVSALSFLLMQVSIPFFTAPYLKVELSEMPVMLLGVFLSPGAALLAQGVKDLLMLVTGGAVIWGALSDFLCGGALVYSFAFAWHKMKKMPHMKRLTACGAIGIAARCLVSIPVNYIILGIEFGKSVQDVTALFLPVILPFNAFKSLCNIIVAGIAIKMLPRRMQNAISLEEGNGGRA